MTDRIIEIDIIDSGYPEGKDEDKQTAEDIDLEYAEVELDGVDEGEGEDDLSCGCVDIGQ